MILSDIKVCTELVRLSMGQIRRQECFFKVANVQIERFTSKCRKQEWLRACTLSIFDTASLFSLRFFHYAFHQIPLIFPANPFNHPTNPLFIPLLGRSNIVTLQRHSFISRLFRHKIKAALQFYVSLVGIEEFIRQERNVRA